MTLLFISSTFTNLFATPVCYDTNWPVQVVHMNRHTHTHTSPLSGLGTVETALSSPADTGEVKQAGAPAE